MDKSQAETAENSQVGSSSAQAVQDVEIDPETQHMLEPIATEFEDDKFWSLSGKPYFHVVLHKSQLKPLYQLMLPKRMTGLLPCCVVPVVLTYCGKEWEMSYYGDADRRRFNPSWKGFAIDNDLKVGDACVFELVESSPTNLKFRVQILRGDFPSQLMEKVNGETSSTPIIVD